MRNIGSYTFISLILTLTLLSGVILASSKVSADDDSVVDEVSITVPVSCTMGSAIATGQDHTATLNPGTYSAATGVYTQGDTISSWSMKVDKVTDSSVSYNPPNMTIKSDTEGVFSSWHSVPSSYTKVAE